MTLIFSQLSKVKKNVKFYYPLADRPKVVCLAGHLGVFLYLVKQGDTIKATVGMRLVKLLSNITLVGAVCRMFGANIYARIRGVHALEYVICLGRYATYFAYFATLLF